MAFRLGLPLAALAGAFVAVIALGATLGSPAVSTRAPPVGRAHLGAAAAPHAAPSPPTPGPRGACGGKADSRDPIATAQRFLQTVVARTDPGRGYQLATKALRGRTTCRDWVQGRIPVLAYRGIDWTRSNYRVVAAGEGQLVLRVVLYAKWTSPAAFLLELRRNDGEVNWQVGTWMAVPLQSADRRLPQEAAGNGGDRSS